MQTRTSRVPDTALTRKPNFLTHTKAADGFFALVFLGTGGECGLHPAPSVVRMGGSQSKKKAVEQVRSEYGRTHTGARHYMGYAITEEGDYVYDEQGNYVFADGVTYAVDEYSGEYMIDETGNYVLAGLEWDYVDAPLTPRSAKKAE